MSVKIFATSAKGKPNVEIGRGLGVVGVEVPEVQMLKLSLHVALYAYRNI
jgi:hypothetical protein